MGGCCLDYRPPAGPYLTKAPILQRGPSRKVDDKPDLILPSLSKIFEETSGEGYADYFRQINEILMGIGMVKDGLGSSQTSNIALLVAKNNQLMGELVKNIASVSVEEASRLVALAGMCLNLKRAIEALDALSFLFEGREEPIESQRKNVNEAVEILVKAFGSLSPRREKELDDVLSRFRFLKITLGGVERIGNKTISILVYKVAYNGYCAARVARGLV
ncbi:MAG: hypothetical protein QW797_00195 [Thermoproteota archaeon]